MKVQVQVVTTNDDGQESIRELACIEREELTAESLGLSVAESKTLLQSLQEIVVEWQMKTYLDSQRHCPDCGQLRHSTGVASYRLSHRLWDDSGGKSSSRTLLVPGA